MKNTNDLLNSKNTKRFRRQALKLQAIQETVPYNDIKEAQASSAKLRKKQSAGFKLRSQGFKL